MNIDAYKDKCDLLEKEVERLEGFIKDLKESNEVLANAVTFEKKQASAGQRAVDTMEKFSNKYKQWVSDYPKVVQKSKFFDDLIEMLQHKEAL